MAACLVLLVTSLLFTMDASRRPSTTVSAAPVQADRPASEVPPTEPAAVSTPSTIPSARRLPAPPVTRPIPAVSTTTIASTYPSDLTLPHPATAANVEHRDTSAPVSPVAPSATVAAAPVSAIADNDTRAPVTITGCLEGTVDGDQFRLTDTDGTGAPKARGWRSGFLKKRPAPVDLVGPDRSGFRKYVGQRVTATGLLTDRELHVRSLMSSGGPCG